MNNIVLDNNSLKPSESGILMNKNGIPIVRVGIIDDENVVDFKVDGKFLILDKNDNVIMDNIESRLKWRVKVEKAEKAKFKYGILLNEFKKREEAEKLAERFNKSEFDVKVNKSGIRYKFKYDVIMDNTRYGVIAGYWDDEREARKYAGLLRDDYDGIIIKEKVSEPSGELEIFDLEYDKFVEKENLICIALQSKLSKMTIFNVKVGKNLLYNRKIDRKLNGKVEFTINNEGKISVVNILSIDEYLNEILRDEFICDASLEFLKAYAIAARGNYLCQLGLQTERNYYDFYSELNYENLLYTDKKAADLIEKAVEETKGFVITYKNNICRSFYTPICGGCIKNWEDFCNSGEKDFLPAVFDTKSKKVEGFSLNFCDEKRVENWINAKPDVYCNLKGEGFGRSLSFAEKYFRWKISYSRRELEEIIKEKSGEDVGTLYDIIPLVREDSGQIKEVEILGSKKNVVLKNDKNIINILSDNELYSTCFIVNAEVGDDGIPIEFTFYGAGYGDGVGMCMVGAMVMAEKKYDYKSIIKHYYNNGSIKKIY